MSIISCDYILSQVCSKVETSFIKNIIVKIL